MQEPDPGLADLPPGVTVLMSLTPVLPFAWHSPRCGQLSWCLNTAVLVGCGAVLFLQFLGGLTAQPVLALWPSAVFALLFYPPGCRLLALGIALAPLLYSYLFLQELGRPLIEAIPGSHPGGNMRQLVAARRGVRAESKHAQEEDQRSGY